MFESLSHLALQQYWWFIISLLAGILVFLMFVQGGQTLIYSIGKTKNERSVLVNSLGRKWEFTFTTLVTFGGAFFASFPLFYSSSFGGAYWLWMIILFSFIIQAIAYEYRSKPNNVFGARVYESFLFINGAFGTFFLGIAVAMLFTGGNFSLNNMNQVQWQSSAHGLEALLNPVNVIFGLTVFFLARTLGILYFQNNVDSETMNKRMVKKLWFNAIPFVVLFITFIVLIFIREGYAYDSDGDIYLEKHKYLHNFLQLPILSVLFLGGVLSVLTGIILSIFKTGYRFGIWYSGLGVVSVVVSLFLVLGYNNTSFYPSYFDLQSSLTIENSSSSFYTLKVMSYVSLMVPFVLAYIVYAWRAINNTPITEEEISSKDSHAY